MLLTVNLSDLGNGITLMQLSGEITLTRECQEIEWKLADLLNRQKTRVVADLSDVSMVDSTGIGILVTCAGNLREAGGGLHLAGAQPFVERVLTMTHVNHIVPMFADTASAAAAFSQSDHA